MNHHQYERIEKAIAFLKQHHQHQPSLADVAEHVHLSPHHFHRVFADFTGITPKSFLQCLTTQYAKNLLQQHSTLETTHALGLSSQSRLFEHLVKLEAVTPGELKAQGQGLHFYHGVSLSPWGKVWLCWTTRGIHTLQFVFADEEQQSLLRQVKLLWPCAEFHESTTEAQRLTDRGFDRKPSQALKLWVKGTPFQLQVWQALLRIPEGEVRTYKAIACDIGQQKACRAVGTAIGKNPIAVLIPCHRVIQQSGAIGGYRWTPLRKQGLLGCEFAREKAKHLQQGEE